MFLKKIDKSNRSIKKMKHIEEAQNIEPVKKINFISRIEKRWRNILYRIILITIKVKQILHVNDFRLNAMKLF